MEKLFISLIISIGCATCVDLAKPSPIQECALTNTCFNKGDLLAYITKSCPVVLLPLERREENTTDTEHFGGITKFCVVTCDDLRTSNFGWGCYDMADRTVRVNLQEVTCSQTPLPSPIMGWNLFEVSAGKSSQPAIHWWGQRTARECSLSSLL